MNKPISRIKSFLKGLKNLFGVGIYLLLMGVLLEGIAIVFHQQLSLPISIPLGTQIALTVLCIFFCAFGIIWFNKTLNLIEINFAGGENTLMTLGPFNFVRHPLYATLLISLPPLFVIWFADVLFIVSWVLIYIIAYLMIMIEERGLVRIFGEDYLIYKRFVPGLLPYKGRGGARYREYFEQIEIDHGAQSA